MESPLSTMVLAPVCPLSTVGHSGMDLFHPPTNLLSYGPSWLLVLSSVFLLPLAYGQSFGTLMLCISLCDMAHTNISVLTPLLLNKFCSYLHAMPVSTYCFYFCRRQVPGFKNEYTYCPHHFHFLPWGWIKHFNHVGAQMLLYGLLTFEASIEKKQNKKVSYFLLAGNFYFFGHFLSKWNLVINYYLFI